MQKNDVFEIEITDIGVKKTSGWRRNDRHEYMSYNVGMGRWLFPVLRKQCDGVGTGGADRTNAAKSKWIVSALLQIGRITAFPDYGVLGKHKKTVYLNSIIMYNKLYFISDKTTFDIQIITYIRIEKTWERIRVNNIMNGADAIVKCLEQEGGRLAFFSGML